MVHMHAKPLHACEETFPGQESGLRFTTDAPTTLAQESRQDLIQ